MARQASHVTPGFINGSVGCGSGPNVVLRTESHANESRGIDIRPFAVLYLLDWISYE